MSVIWLLSSCEVINPEEEIPAYIHIPAFELSTSSGQGTESHNITDAWVYIDEDIQGIYELPVTFPVLDKGTHTVTLRPGIKINGIASTRINYPFFKDVEFELKLEALSQDTLLPTTRYQDNVTFEWMENFESPGLSIRSLQDDDTTLSKVSDPDMVFEGSSAALIRLDGDNTYFQGASIDEFDLPGGLTPTYLEINFKTNNRLVIGLIANTFGNSDILPVLVLNTTEEWKKIYVNLGATISRQSSLADFNIYFEASLDDGIDEAEILIDNIKLIHY